MRDSSRMQRPFALRIGVKFSLIYRLKLGHCGFWLQILEIILEFFLQHIWYAMCNLC